MKIIGFLLMAAGLASVIWPAPLFTLNEPYLTWYMENILATDSRPGGAAAALPVLWLFVTLPAGILAIGAGAFLFSFGEKDG